MDINHDITHVHCEKCKKELTANDAFFLTYPCSIHSHKIQVSTGPCFIHCQECWKKKRMFDKN